MQFVNHHKTLHIKPSSSEIGIKQAYKQLSLQYHPDKLLLNFPECATNVDHLKELQDYYLSIQTAWAILSDSQAKKEYDHELRKILLITEEVHYELNLADIDIEMDQDTEDILIPCSRCEFRFPCFFEPDQDFVITSCDQCNMRYKINIDLDPQNGDWSARA